MVIITSFCILLPVIIITLLVLRLFKKKKTVAFFHPNCSSSGGGEMVLWEIVKVLLETQQLDIVIYTASDPDKKKILARVKENFGLVFDATRITFYSIGKTYPLVTKKYPFLTLFFQAIGSLICVFQALLKCNAEYFFDTTGCAFTYLFAALSGGKVLSYTHYPTISSDMLSVVENRETAINNNETVARSPLLSTIKLYYYKIFAFFYWIVGKIPSLVFVNGSWTQSHIERIWGIHPILLFPPCDFKSEECPKTKNLVISIGQFRPEKKQKTQVECMKLLFEKHPDLVGKVELVIIGGTRDEEDNKRKEEISGLIKKYDLTESITIDSDVDYEKKLDYLRNAKIGLHTMVNEHFGICVVEYMGFGVIPIANNSAGPKLDIVDQESGYLASTPDEYADAIFKIVSDDKAAEVMSKHARIRAERFSVQNFEKECQQHLDKFFKDNKE
ncbi:glycosyl transferase, putative [Entamoeba invadens IP1]|uniref:GDP-Man:Man(3)GlcNAc(2)-PP-Dol alpha-1,2-mannosyltransferase n=1 Tax=Entamoeba invadens IP1 TaxID=370355 RepID=A0A0A1U4A1_ENTIV|nr:glycosyl transferase, putative [Entamoeba invadens IP1]ELP88995.1 glycosyl transferase, putative [Entamoeba invadens IP1]|eukprot:XP_004255766.1 glycosyl transferase, putative [Entamoeba invadens IP1]